MSKHYIIVGGVAGGASAATRLRRLDEDAQITIYEAGPYVSFANCGLPYYVGGTIEDREALLVSSVEELKANFNIDVFVNHRVVSIDPSDKRVTIKTPEGEKQDKYDKLILSTGARAFIPPFDGLEEADNAFTVRSVPDVDAITDYLKTHIARHATVIGGGFIGLEMVENLKKRGLAVTLVEASAQVLPPLDWEMVQIVHEHLQDNDIDLRLNTRVTGLSNHGTSVEFDNGQTLSTDLVIIAIGVRPNSEIAKDAGVNTDARGFINVNSHFETNVEDIYAIGDVINVTDSLGQSRSIALAGPANRQGRYLADVLNGIAHENPSVLGSSVAKIFALTAASTGANERALKQANVAYHAVHLHPSSSASYYPGAAPISLKVLYGMDGKILGAQAVGTSKVDSRIDMIATTIHFGGTIADLSDIEVCYAPPYASAKDPVNFAGYVADNLQRGLADSIQWNQVDELLAKKAYFLDVREEDELLAEPMLQGAHNIPRSTVREHLDTLPKDEPIYVYCAVGLRGYNVCRTLSQHGFNAVNIDGGLKTYRTATYDVQKNNHEAVFSKEKDAATVVSEPLTPTQADKTLAAASEPVSSAYATKQATGSGKHIDLNACGLQCPGPIVKVKDAMATLEDGDSVTVTASDFGFHKDIVSWADATGNTVLSNKIEGDKVVATLQKGQENAGLPAELPSGNTITKTAEGTTIVVFDGDFDKAIASLIIAQGAAAMGQPVTMFFTFWGLSVIKKPGVKVKKSGLAKAFDLALPGHAAKLPLSKMNFFGAGRAMIKHLMRSNNVDQLEVMLDKAQQVGVKMVACTMSMGLMGVEEDELIDGVELGGVAAYLGDARQRSTNLFI